MYLILILTSFLISNVHAFVVPNSEVKLTYILEDHFNYSGGVKQANVVNGLAFLEFSAHDIEFIPKLGNTDLYLSIMGYHGKSPTKQVGDLQWTSNIDANGNEGVKIYEAFFKQDIFSERLRFRLGLLDLSLVYNINEPALLFAHSTPGTTAEWGLSGPHGAPVYPWPTFAMDLQFDAVDGHYIYGALGSEYAGNRKDSRLTQENVTITKDEHFSILEVGRNFSRGKIGFGYWNYARNAPRIDNQLRFAQQNGWYVIADAKIGNKIHPFFRYGQMTNDLTNPIKGSMSTGVAFSRPFGLEKDVWGLMVSPSYLSKSYVAQSKKRQNHETAYEIVYRHHFTPVTDGLISYMYVDGPAGGTRQDEPSKRITDANVIILRLIFKI